MKSPFPLLNTLFILLLCLLHLHAQQYSIDTQELQQLRLELNAVQEKLTYIKEQYADTLENVREDNNETLV